MDLSLVLNLLPAQYVAVIFAVAGVAAAVAALLPPPKATTGIYAAVYAVVNFVGVNLGHAKNASAPPATPKVVPMWILAALAGLILSACGNPAVTPVAVAQAVSLEAATLEAAFASLPAGVTVPGTVTAAVADVQVAADAFAKADTNAAKLAIVVRIEADVNAVAVAASQIPNLPADTKKALTVAVVLLPAIEAGVNMAAQ